MINFLSQKVIKYTVISLILLLVATTSVYYAFAKLKPKKQQDKITSQILVEYCADNDSTSDCKPEKGQFTKKINSNFITIEINK